MTRPAPSHDRRCSTFRRREIAGPLIGQRALADDELAGRRTRYPGGLRRAGLSPVRSRSPRPAPASPAAARVLSASPRGGPGRWGGGPPHGGTPPARAIPCVAERGIQHEDQASAFASVAVFHLLCTRRFLAWQGRPFYFTGPPHRRLDDQPAAPSHREHRPPGQCLRAGTSCELAAAGPGPQLDERRRGPSRVADVRRRSGHDDEAKPVVHRGPQIPGRSRDGERGSGCAARQMGGGRAGR